MSKIGGGDERLPAFGFHQLRLQCKVRKKTRRPEGTRLDLFKRERTEATAVKDIRSQIPQGEICGYIDQDADRHSGADIRQDCRIDEAGFRRRLDAAVSGTDEPSGPQAQPSASADRLAGHPHVSPIKISRLILKIEERAACFARMNVFRADPFLF